MPIGSVNLVFRKIIIEVPKGTNLGRLLFLLYTNDMRNSYQMMLFINFADDTSDYATGEHLNAIYDVLVAVLVELVIGFLLIDCLLIKPVLVI